MSDQTRFLLRKVAGDQPVGTEQEIREWLQRGQCKPSDFLFDFTSGNWSRVGDHPAVVDLFAEKPAQPPERRLIYITSPGSATNLQGPYSTKEVQGRIQARELCESSWVFVEGDKEWRQVRAVKVLFGMLAPLPEDKPAPPQPAAPAAGAPAGAGDFAIEGLELGSNRDPKQESQTSIPALMFDEPEEITKAVSALGLAREEPPPPPKPAAPKAAPAAPPAPEASPELAISLEPPAPPAAPARPAPAPSRPQAPPAAPKAAPAVAPPAAGQSIELELGSAAQPKQPADKDSGHFDGITARIPTDPIWLVKRGPTDTIAGPFRFLEIVKFLEDGKLNKADKISRAGTNRFVKISHQYEFNVKFSIETVVEKGVEKQTILIKRRHPRVPYIADLQIMAKQGTVHGSCVNISAGGILIEVSKAEFNLGDLLDVKILPAHIPKPISCRAMVIGKIPKMPPGYALKFETLKPEDKEAIEFFVQEALKREMSNS